MTTRAPPKRAPPKRAAAPSNPPSEIETNPLPGLNFKLLLRDEALQIKDITESRASALYDICRVKANQVMMMKRRGYEIPEDELDWIQCSLDESKLVSKIRGLRNLTVRELVKNVLNKKYTITRTFIPDQTTFTFYPYLEEGGEELRLGEFYYQGGEWKLSREEDRIVETRTYQTEVEYTDKLDITEYGTLPFRQIPHIISVFMDSEKNFQTEMRKMVEYRKRGVEIFHTSELFIDYFQHWLVPDQRPISDVERIHLLSPYLMVRDEKEGGFQKTLNSRISEQSLPTIHHTDIVVRYMGVLPGKIIYWENDSYISSFSTKEFGYMLVSGYKYNTNSAANPETNAFGGEQRPAAEEELDEELREEDLENGIEEEDLENGIEED